jgi:hypothetical protein
MTAHPSSTCCASGRRQSCGLGASDPRMLPSCRVCTRTSCTRTLFRRGHMEGTSSPSSRWVPAGPQHAGQCSCCLGWQGWRTLFLLMVAVNNAFVAVAGVRGFGLPLDTDCCSCLHLCSLQRRVLSEPEAAQVMVAVLDVVQVRRSGGGGGVRRGRVGWASSVRWQALPASSIGFLFFLS